jgi:hypothetical protein
MQDGEKGGCWFMTMGHDMVWKWAFWSLMQGRAEKRERDNVIFSGRRGRERELYWVPLEWVEREKKLVS